MKSLWVLLLIFALAGPVWADSDLNEAAADVCVCLEAPYAEAEKAIQMIQDAQQTGDMSALMAAQGEMMGVISASATCFEGLTQKYPDIAQDPQLQSQVMAIADQECPNPAAAFGATMGAPPPQ